MAVLIEAISVVVRADELLKKFPGVGNVVGRDGGGAVATISKASSETDLPTSISLSSRQNRLPGLET